VATGERDSEQGAPQGSEVPAPSPRPDGHASSIWLHVQIPVNVPRHGAAAVDYGHNAAPACWKPLKTSSREFVSQGPRCRRGAPSVVKSSALDHPPLITGMSRFERWLVIFP